MNRGSNFEGLVNELEDLTSLLKVPEFATIELASFKNRRRLIRTYLETGHVRASVSGSKMNNSGKH